MHFNPSSFRGKKGERTNRAGSKEGQTRLLILVFILPFSMHGLRQLFGSHPMVAVACNLGGGKRGEVNHKHSKNQVQHHKDSLELNIFFFLLFQQSLYTYWYKDLSTQCRPKPCTFVGCHKKKKKKKKKKNKKMFVMYSPPSPPPNFDEFWPVNIVKNTRPSLTKKKNHNSYHIKRTLRCV